MSNKQIEVYSYKARQGYLMLDGWAGRHDYAVLVIGETPKKYRIRAVIETKLRRRWLSVGDEALVPKDAVRLA